MIELKSTWKQGDWQSITASIRPNTNLTAREQKILADRNALLDKIEQDCKPGQYVWVKLNSGIFRGSIFEVKINSGTGWDVSATVDNRYQHTSGTNAANLYQWTKDLDQSKGWGYSLRRASIHHFNNWRGAKPIKFPTGEVIFTEFFSKAVMDSASILLDYKGGPVFSMNTKSRPEKFIDRLGQEVGIGDLVVVARQYGAGLDICFIRGYADQRRVVIEGIETPGDYDRIALEDNESNKIMMMPNSLKDTAMLLKLARK